MPEIVSVFAATVPGLTIGAPGRAAASRRDERLPMPGERGCESRWAVQGISGGHAGAIRGCGPGAGAVRQHGGGAGGGRQAFGAGAVAAAADDHQRKNAEVLFAAGAAVMLLQRG